MSDYKNEPAFASAGEGFNFPGLTRLEYFAAAALQGMLTIMASPKADVSCIKDDKEIAQTAFQMAEAMCQEAEKRREAK